MCSIDYKWEPTDHGLPRCYISLKSEEHTRARAPDRSSILFSQRHRCTTSLPCATFRSSNTAQYYTFTKKGHLHVPHGLDGVEKSFLSWSTRGLGKFGLPVGHVPFLVYPCLLDLREEHEGNASDRAAKFSDDPVLAVKVQPEALHLPALTRATNVTVMNVSDSASRREKSGYS